MTNIYKNILIVAMIVWSSTFEGVRVNASGYPGETRPVTVEAAIGDSFNITCYMNPKAFPGNTSKCLDFVNGRNSEVLPRENILIINSTTIIYMVRNAVEQQMEYRCKCGVDAIMETKVFVGTPPKPVTNFTCNSYDFDHMICNFTKPANPVLTTYNVSYYSEKMTNYRFRPRCNFDDRILVVCNITLKDRYAEHYNFIIDSTNALVKNNVRPLSQEFKVNNLEVMIPSKPGEDLRADNFTVDGIRLTWQMANYEMYRSKGLQWEVLVQPENGTVIEGEPPVRDRNEMRLRLSNLPYAYWQYQVKLRVRVKHTKAQWSEQRTFTFRTAAQRPQRPPSMQPGSFYINSAETSVTLYWEELQPYEYNGYNFTYVIRSVRRDGHLIDLEPSQLERNLATFPWQKSSRYEFEIGSRNHMGDSLEASRLIIHPFNKILNSKHYTPNEINNVYHANNRTYTLTWSQPYRSVGLQSYTVFWCYPKRALPNECKESMHFQQVPPNQLNFTTEKQNPLEEHTLNLAISANYEYFNTGLHWTACTMDVNSDLVKTDPDLTALNNSIRVQWRVERVCTSILSGFNITYCEVADDVSDDMHAENATCLDTPQTITRPKQDKSYKIDNLKPFTLYKVTMYMFSRNKNGRPSDPRLMRTLEGAPSPPRHLKVFNVTQYSACIKWMEPSMLNGKIRKYIIMLNNDKFEVNASTLEYPLVNLESFTSYKVYVMAQTVQTSDTSNDVHFTTAISNPSPPGQPSSPTKNTSIIQWAKPAKPNGRLEFYEVSVTQMRNDEVMRQKKSIVMGGEMACAFQAPICIGPEYQTRVDVRAVNAASLSHEVPEEVLYHHMEEYSSSYDYTYYNDNADDLICEGGHQTKENHAEIKRYFNTSLYHLYESPWHTSAIYSCSPSRLSKITTIALVVIAMSLGVMAALYMARKKYNKMANINCTLPAGLESYFTKDNNGFPGGEFGNVVGAHAKSFQAATREAEDQWINATRNFRNEHHHLLASLGNDSGYLGGGCGGVNIDGHILSSSLETANNSEDREDKQRDNEVEDDEEEYEKGHLSSSADSLVESSDESESRNHSDAEEAPLSLFPNDNGYVKQSMIQPWQNFQEINETANKPSAITTNANGNGYITVQSLQANPAPQNSGYILQQDLQNFFHNAQAQHPTTSSGGGGRADVTPNVNENLSQFNSGGYTTLEDLAKINSNSTAIRPPSEDNTNRASEASIKTSTATNASGGVAGGGNGNGGVISGYVTQQDLNLFAQHQQH